MARNHKWNKDDTIITFYYVKYGLKGLPVNDEKELAECVIGSTRTSLQMQSSNIRYILGYDSGTLTDFSKIQHDVVNEFSKKSEDCLKKAVLEIIDKRDFEDNLDKLREIKNQKEIERRKKQSQSELEAIFRRMGKDPSKMKRIVK